MLHITPPAPPAWHPLEAAGAERAPWRGLCLCRPVCPSGGWMSVYRRLRPPELSRSLGSAVLRMMSAFGGLDSPCGSCLLDSLQPWVLKLPPWPCSCCLPHRRAGGGHGGVGSERGGGEVSHRHCCGDGGLAHKVSCWALLAPWLFCLSLPPSFPARSFIHSFIRVEHRLWARCSAGSGGKGKQEQLLSLALGELQLGLGVRLQSVTFPPTSEPWALKAGRQPSEVG